MACSHSPALTGPQPSTLVSFPFPQSAGVPRGRPFPGVPAGGVVWGQVNGGPLDVPGWGLRRELALGVRVLGQASALCP